MAERLFYAGLLVLTFGYLYFAFFVIKAPFQYDPLGPETWPQLLGSLIAIALVVRLVKPSGVRLKVAPTTAGRLVIVVVAMALYAILYESLGFILSTWAFCTGITWLLGTKPVRAVAFGATVGFLTFFSFTDLLDLNLPGGLLEFLD